MVDIAAAVKRYVPGAEALVPSSNASSTKTSKNKKKADKKKGTSTPGDKNEDSVAADAATMTTTTTTTDDKPVALLSQAPTADELPKELVADPREVEKELAKDQEQPQERKKGPAEEMVFKRIKLLNKKIQRFEGYQAKDESQLNPDQKAAIASLPVLKGGLRELEDVQKALEAVEVETAKERKTLTDGHATQIESAKRQAVENYKSTIFPTLSLLISTYSSLHPQAPAASFMPPDLPAHLQEISSSEVRRVDELYERIREGKDVDGALEEAEVTLQHLAANKHVEPSTPADAEPVVDADAPNFSPKPLNDQSLPQDSQPTAGIMTFGSSNTNEITPSAVEAHEAFRHEPAVAEQPPAADAYAPAATTTTTSSVADGTVSFMQSSEIQDAPVQPQQTQQMETATAASAPVLAEPVAPVPAAIEAVQVEQRALGTETPKFNWADDDDHDGMHDLNAIRAQLNIPNPTTQPQPSANESVAGETAQVPQATSTGGRPPRSAGSQGVGRGGGGGGRGGIRTGRPAGAQNGQGERGPRQDGQNRGPRPQHQQRQNAKGTGRTPPAVINGVDEDGFTVISKRQPSYSQQQQQQGGRGGGAGRGGQQRGGGGSAGGRGGSRTPSRGGLPTQA